MNPGKLNTRVLIKQLLKSDDGYGGFTNTLTTYDTIWASVKQVDGDRSSEFGQIETKVRVELLCRKNTITPITDAIKEFIFQIEGNDVNYRVNNIYQSEFKHITKITGTKIE